LDGSNLALLIFIGISIALLFWMLFSLNIRSKTKVEEKPRAFCPICKNGLFSGQRIRSDVLEIGKTEVRTTLKGCQHCLDGNAKRLCPVCKKKLAKNEFIIAFSDPQVDKKRLSIRGCKTCYPQAFD
jgi:hypothetical protein